MILYNNTYEREGNDSWLIDKVMLHYDDMGLYLYHKWKHSGWQGEDTGSHTLNLDVDDLEKSQKRLDAYIDENNLQREFPNGESEGIFIKLNELIETNNILT
jgi:hypothetical protein